MHVVWVPRKSWWQTKKIPSRLKSLNFAGPFTVCATLQQRALQRFPTYAAPLKRCCASFNSMETSCALKMGRSLHSDWPWLRWWDLHCLIVGIVAVSPMKGPRKRSAALQDLFSLKFCEQDFVLFLNVHFGDLNWPFRDFPLVFILALFFFQCRNRIKMWKTLNAFRETQPLILGLSKHGSLFFFFFFFPFPTLKI